MIEFELNDQKVRLDVSPDMPLLWALREAAGLTGTKFGCGIGACGACTVHVDGNQVRSCVVLVSAVEGKSITTIEGLSADGSHPIQNAWVAEEVPQCGYCQSGMIMAAAALLERTPDPSKTEIDAAITNICRCGTYERIRRAIHRAAKAKSSGASE